MKRTRRVRTEVVRIEGGGASAAAAAERIADGMEETGGLYSSK